VQAFTLAAAAGFAAEAKALGALIVTPESKGLVNLFFLTNAARSSAASRVPWQWNGRWWSAAA